MHDFWLIISLWLIAITIFVFPYSMPAQDITVESATPANTNTILIIPSLPQPEIIQEREITQPNFLVSDQIADLTSMIHDNVNAERTDRGIKQLEWDKTLADAALGHATHLADNKYVSHVDKDGNGPSDRATCYNAEFDSSYGAGENIVQMSTHKGLEYSAQDAVNAWMFSPGHAANIKLPAWTSAGIGIALDDTGIAYVVQMFC
ncbi:MAG: CAP domain-containing protein [Thaumarchaeota archaeon]|nr:CAP domain-containing protein [Nitrososphaerota archaeon]